MNPEFHLPSHNKSVVNGRGNWSYPGKPKPYCKVTGNFQTCLLPDLNLDSVERKPAISGNVLDHQAIWAGLFTCVTFTSKTN